MDKAEVDVFLELSCFFYDQTDVSSTINTISTFSPPSGQTLCISFRLNIPTVVINIVSMKVDDFGCKFCLVKGGSLLETYFGQGDGLLAQFSSHTFSFEIEESS